MAKSTIQLAQSLLQSNDDTLEEIRMHEFDSDESAHDDALQERLLTEFEADFAKLQAELESRFGRPTEIGEQDHEEIPLAGVFRFATWEVSDKLLFAAATHEDRELPFLLLIGTASRSDE